MSTLSLDPGVSLFEPVPRPLPPPAAAPVRPAPVAPAAVTPAAGHGRHAARPHAAHARRTSARIASAGAARAGRLVAVRALGTSVAAAAVTWALVAKSPGNASDVASLSLRGLAAAAVICAAWGFQDRARLGALGATRTWYATAALLALAHTSWFATTTPGPWHDHLPLVAAVFTLDVVLVVVPALLGARAGRPESAPA